MEETVAYSFRRNLKFVLMMFSRPRQVIAEFLTDLSLWYGINPFILYISLFTVGGILTYTAGINAPINPLPKMLPIPDKQYALYQIVFGPFIKLAGLFLFSGLVFLFTKYLYKHDIVTLPVINFFMFIGFTLAVLAVIIDQIILWGNIEGGLRFWLSTIHPIVLVVQLLYVTAFFHEYSGYSLKSSALIITISTFISYPLPGMFFR